MSLGKWIEDNKNNLNFTINENGIVFTFANGMKPINDKETLLTLIETDPYIVQFASTKLKNDLAIAKAAVGLSPSSICFFGDSIKNNKEVFKTAVEGHGYYLHNIGEELVKDREFIKTILVNDVGSWFKFISGTYGKDREIVLLAVKSGCALKDIDICFREDVEIVCAYVSRYKMNLSKVSLSMKDNEEVVLAAVNGTYGKAYTYAGPTVKDNIEIAKIALSYDPTLVKFTSKRIKEIINQYPSIDPVSSLEAYTLSLELGDKDTKLVRPKI